MAYVRKESDWRELNSTLAAHAFPQVGVAAGVLDEDSLLCAFRAVLKSYSMLQQAKWAPKAELQSKPTKTFRHFMDRAPSLSSESDKKVLNLIRYFDHRKSLLTKEAQTSSPQVPIFSQPTQASFHHTQVSSQTSFSESETLHLLQKKAAKLEKLRHALGNRDCLRRAKAIGTFCHLFEAGQTNPEEVVQSVYFFVAEIKHFLSVIAR